VTRAVCRRTERIVVPLVRDGHLHKEVLIYLNRLSDFLFIVSRIAAKLDKRTESIYIPKPDEKVQAQ
jgi:cob(I)alamin adenosyltransferase